jgi:hypothetical protein
LDLQLPVQSVHITTKGVSSIPVHGQVYSIQHYVIKFVSDLWQVGGFLRVLRYNWNIVESGVKYYNPPWMFNVSNTTALYSWIGII